MRLRLDPWAHEYNTAYLVEEVPVETLQHVDPSIEHETWQAVSPESAKALYQSLYFLDGSQRLEARVLLEDEKRQLAFGALGSFGVGAVWCPVQEEGQRAEFVDLSLLELPSIQRICALSGGHSFRSFVLSGGIKVSVVPLAETDADACVREIQNQMLTAERRLAVRLHEHNPKALVICDGPRPRTNLENVIGYLKTMHQLVLDEKHLSLVRSLKEGQRSPLYLVGGADKSQQYFEWFLRLRSPSPWFYSFAGMVRLQAYAGSEPRLRLARVKALADWLCILLPQFSSRQFQDPRAPQQLLPIRALEGELRRLMGSRPLIRRRILQYLQENA